MIKIQVTSKNSKVERILISGHAGYGKNGQDIVCAAVSSIAVTTVNAILRIDSEAIIYSQSEDLSIVVQKHTDVTDTLIENMLGLFVELQENYGKYININREVS